MIYLLGFKLIKTFESWHGAVQCLSGPMVMIKRDIYLKIMPEVKLSNFLGIRCSIGEDRHASQVLLRHGYNNVYNDKAVCFTNVPNTWNQYLKQSIRWRKSALGQWIDAFKNYKEYVINHSFISLILSLFPVFIMVAWNVLIYGSLADGYILDIYEKLIMFYMATSPIFIWFYIKSIDKREKMDSYLVFLLEGFFFSIYAPFSAVYITLFAMTTLDNTGWLSRN